MDPIENEKKIVQLTKTIVVTRGGDFFSTL